MENEITQEKRLPDREKHTEAQSRSNESKSRREIAESGGEVSERIRTKSSEKRGFPEGNLKYSKLSYGATSNPGISTAINGRNPGSPRKLYYHSISKSLDRAFTFLDIPLNTDGGGDDDPSSPSTNTTSRDYASLFVVYVLTLVSEGARGLVMHTIWPFLSSLGGKKSTLGFLIASYSFGRVISTVPLGALTDRFRTSYVLIGASFMQIVGHLIYSSATSVNRLFIGRIFVGVGSATSAIARAHVARAIPRNDRTRHYAYLCCTQFVGLAGLPALGGLLDMLPQFELSFITLNGFTYPGIVLALANLVSIWIIWAYFKCPSYSAQQEDNSERQAGQVLRTSKPAPENSNISSDDSYDVLALIILLFFNLLFRGVISQLETVTVPFLIERFHVLRITASFSLSTISICGIVVFLNIEFLTEKYSTRRLVGIGLFSLTLSVVPLSMHFLESRVPIFVYVLFLCFPWSVAYPVGYTAVLSLFSKRLGPLPVGRMMGIFSAVGAIAPLIFAPIAGTIWETHGRSNVFLFITTVSAMSVILFIQAFNRFKPREAMSV